MRFESRGHSRLAGTCQVGAITAVFVLAGDESEQQIIQDVLQGSPGMSLNTASGFADASISVF